MKMMKSTRTKRMKNSKRSKYIAKHLGDEIENEARCGRCWTTL